MSPAVSVFSCLLFAILWTGYRWLISTHPPNPPGPPRLPLLGNIFSTPKSKPWLTYSRWRREYGDLVFLSGLGKRILVVNSLESAVELLEGRSGIYSDRPYMPMADLTGWSRAHTVFLPYGDLWRKHRRMLHERFKKEAVLQDRDVAVHSTTQLLSNMLQSPDDFAEYCEHYVSSLTMSIIYGRHDLPTDDPILATIQATLRAISESALSGSMLINFIPQLRYLPEWLPGLQFKREARRCQVQLREMIDLPFEAAKDERAPILENQSWTSELLQRMGLDEEDDACEDDTENIIKNVTSSAFSAAVETSSSTLKVFIQAMILFPEAQHRAQEEIDSVTGGERLPCFDDMPHMPYVAALCREVRRWRPVATMAVPHVSVLDDVYHGYFIPKGTLVWPNVWEMCHDASYYDQPDKFLPERFLDINKNLVKDNLPVFGFGRRICPGLYLAEEIGWIAIASILAAFTIKKARDERGQEIDVSADKYSDGSTVAPLPFKCSIVPRSDHWREIVLATKTAYSK